MTDSSCSNLKNLLRHVLGYKVGILAREIELVHISTGKPPSEQKSNVAIDDRFRLKIPITNQCMVWEVIFNCSLPHSPPDFELNDIDFFYSLTVDSAEELLPSLCDWDYRKDKALINVISELRSAYLRYQVERLSHIDNRFGYEYTTLINEGRVPAEQVEVLITEGNVVNFFVKLDVNLPYIPNTDDYFIVLSVSYGTLSPLCEAMLYSSLNVHRSLGTSIELPHKLKSDESLSEYTDEVVRSIDNQVVTVILKRHKKRCQFIFYLLKDFGHSIISYDAIDYKSASFLVEKEGFVCIMEVTFPDTFPSYPPRFRLLSCYMTGANGQPFSQVFTLPFSESWDISTIFQQSVNLVFSKKIQQFRDSTMSMFKLPK